MSIEAKPYFQTQGFCCKCNTITINLHMATQEEFYLPVIRNGECEWVVPYWVSAKEPTRLILNGYQCASPQMRAFAAKMFFDRTIAGKKLSDLIEITLNDR